jgi:deoxyribonuclease IV
MTSRALGAAPADGLGAHMSVAGGLHRALERGRAAGCAAVQIFVKNQLQWASTPLSEADVRRWTAARRATGIRHTFAHASYLINLGTPRASQWRRAVGALHDELERAEALGLSLVVVHPGSHRGAGIEAGLARVGAALDELTGRTRGYQVGIALENTAGAGDTLGRTFAELGRLLEHAREPERLGVCLDTCHLFAAGYDLRGRAGYDAAMAECAAAVGAAQVRAFHLNDARARLGSGLDRHQHIGRGRLGLLPFRLLLNDARWRSVPKVLETPKDTPTADRTNLRTLRRLIERR